MVWALHSILTGFSKVHCYLDDIFIHGKDIAACYQNVVHVLYQLKEYNARIKSENRLNWNLFTTYANVYNLLFGLMNIKSAFKITKKWLLTFYDPNLPFYVTCVSSGYGVGADLSHRIKGIEKLVLFASATLSKAGEVEFKFRARMIRNNVWSK